ncbi:transcription factor SPT20 homolog, partial [Gigantopelta aegis]|uniref:transcription factor SPT20 homolog n=1 Tax=Gigantopelta aegis TaxID=1735272 RepID=UPI001B888C19
MNSYKRVATNNFSQQRGSRRRAFPVARRLSTATRICFQKDSPTGNNRNCNKMNILNDEDLREALYKEDHKQQQKSFPLARTPTANRRAFPVARKHTKKQQEELFSCKKTTNSNKKSFPSCKTTHQQQQEELSQLQEDYQQQQEELFQLQEGHQQQQEELLAKKTVARRLFPVAKRQQEPREFPSCKKTTNSNKKSFPSCKKTTNSNKKNLLISNKALQQEIEQQEISILNYQRFMSSKKKTSPITGRHQQQLLDYQQQNVILEQIQKELDELSKKKWKSLQRKITSIKTSWK